MKSSTAARGMLAAGAWGLMALGAAAQEAARESKTVSVQGGYKLPPREIVEIVDAAPTPSVSVSPDGGTLLFIHRESLPPIAEIARPMERLAGLRLDATTNGPHGPRSAIGLSLRSIEGGEEREVRLPRGAAVGSPSWSPDGSRFAFTITGESGIQLWVGETESGRARAMTGFEVNGAAGGFDWLGDSRRIVARLVPAKRGPKPERSGVPGGPVVQENDGRTAPVRTFQDLLQDGHDEAMFDWMMTSQVVVIDAQRRRVEKIGEPGVYGSVEPSPDGRYLLVERVERPYSYLVTMGSFPAAHEVWTIGGERVAVVAEHGLLDAVPLGGVQTGRRSIGWQANAGATLVWAEALDGGDPKAKAAQRDVVMKLAAPFTGGPVEVARLEDRFSGIQWVDSGELGMVSEFDRDERRSRTWMVDFAAPGMTPALVFDRNTQDRYADPGRPMTGRNRFGRSVALVHDGAVFLSGAGATPEGDRPFLDRMPLGTFKPERLWRNEGEQYESVVDLLSADGSVILTSVETPRSPANYVVRDLGAGTSRAITAFEDPHPQLAGVTRELVKYPRADGVELTATLYLPAGYREGERLPLLVWAYPNEFNDAATASQVSGSPHRFTRIGGYSHLFLLTQGYAIMDNAAMPVIGSDPETVNDTFLSQIVANGRAAIDYAVSRGVADRERVAVGGHSYGAFMTANLLAHSDIFRAGIARSGAYNRTLTPFGFQSERRTFWEAPEVYMNLSPFMHADRVNEPLLLIHGEADNNSGTFPMQSERMYHAVKGHGGRVRLVMLPHESHGYRARESTLHVLAEQIEWLDRHVKNAGAAGGGAGGAVGGRAGSRGEE